MKKLLTLLFLALSLISGWTFEEKKEFKTAVEEFFLGDRTTETAKAGND
jgi:hypothetical protein